MTMHTIDAMARRGVTWLLAIAVWALGAAPAHPADDWPLVDHDSEIGRWASCTT